MRVMTVPASCRFLKNSFIIVFLIMDVIRPLKRYRGIEGARETYHSVIIWE